MGACFYVETNKGGVRYLALGSLWVGMREPMKAEGAESSRLWQSQPLGDRAQERPKGEACYSLYINFVLLADRKPMLSVASVNKD